MNKCAKIVQAVKKLNSILRERLNFRRRPLLCTTLYRNLMQASNFGGTFDQLFLWILLWNCQRRCLSTSSIPRCKNVKNDQKPKSGGSRLKFWAWNLFCSHIKAGFLSPFEYAYSPAVIIERKCASDSHCTRRSGWHHPCCCCHGDYVQAPPIAWCQVNV